MHSVFHKKSWFSISFIVGYFIWKSIPSKIRPFFYPCHAIVLRIQFVNSRYENFRLSTSIYNLVLLNVCHFHHHQHHPTFWQFIDYRDTRAYILDLCIQEFCLFKTTVKTIRIWFLINFSSDKMKILGCRNPRYKHEYLNSR